MATKVYDKKIKVLAYCDAPTCATGFGTVSRNIFEGLFRTGRYQIDILGINYWGDPHNLPYRIWPVGTNSERDPYGRKKIANMIARANIDFDILFFLQDTFIMDFLPELMGFLKEKGSKHKSICYFPVDGTPKEQWIKNINATDYPVAYTEYGKREALAVFPGSKPIEVIPHGVNTADYYVHPEAAVQGFRGNYFGHNASKFIFTNLNRNQQRKDIPRTIHAFKLFKEQVPDSLLYLHMAKKDVGWDLLEVVKAYGLSPVDDVVFPENFGPNQGYPREIVNMIYNCSDCILSTTVGEGWGLSWIEAMATKTPVIMPANTALIENITEDRGYLVRSGSNESLYTVIPHDNEVIRPLVDVDHLVETMLHVYNNQEEAKQKAETAYNWVTTELNWQTGVVPKWVKFFDKAYADLQKTESKIVVPDANKIITAEEF